jgi:acetamidase/formamidase
MHELDAGQVHYEWNHAIPPRLRIEPGDTVVFQTRDAADGYYSRASTHADVVNRGPFRGHPLTGPVEVRGAEPGDVLVVEVLDMKPAADFGWTAIRPGRGLLPESEFSKPFLQIWDLSDGTHARMDRRVAVPIEAFPGVMGTALDEPGSHSTMPPRKNGGNMDIKQLTRDSTLILPVWMPGALFSVGDGHGAQGDGEVCVTAVEMRAQVTLRFGLSAAGISRAAAQDYAPPRRGHQYRTVVRHHRARARSVRLLAARGAPHDRPSRPGARVLARGSVHHLQRGRRPQDQRDRRRAQLDRLRLHPGEHLP